MVIMQNYLYDYILENAQFFNEFDRSNFISNASMALTDFSFDLALNVKADSYSGALERSVSHINNIEIESYAISEFVSKILNSGRIESAKLTMKDITKLDKITIRPQYLVEAINAYKVTINGIASGKVSANDVKSTYVQSDKIVETLKKRLVVSSIDINITPKEMVKFDLSNKVSVTTSYLEESVIPFLQDVPRKKKELIDEVSNISHIVNSTVVELKRLIEDINTGIRSNMIDDTKKKLMLNYTYNYVRAIMECVSFVTYATMRKIHQFELCVVECQDIYNALVLVFNDNMTIIESGILDNNIVSTDIEKMSDELSDGKNDIFEDLAPQILRYHQGHLSTNISPAVEPDSGEVKEYMLNLLENHEYNTEIYHNIVKSYIEIGNGLEIIAKNSDDQFIVIDDILAKSGFMLSLSDRFRNELSAIDDLSQYSLTDIEIGSGNEKTGVYYIILSEINDYPKITKQIADACHVIHKKVNYVRDILDTRTSDPLATSESLNELRFFIDTFEDQLKAFNTQVVKGLYNRLKLLADKADRCTDNINSSFEDDYYMSNDFFGEAVLATLEEYDNINDIVMEVLLKEYYAEREFKERGVRLVYEADGNSPTVKINDGSSETGTAPSATSAKVPKNKLEELNNSISEWFTKMIESFKDVINRQKAKNTKWIAENKEALSNRSYSNVEIQILPYEKLDPTKITQDITKLTNNVRNMNVNNLKNISTYENLRSKLINFGPKFNNEDEKTSITNYYKVGNNPAQVVTYANNNIKTLIVNNMLPYCENFYHAYSVEVEKQLTELKNAMETISKTYVTESVNELIDVSFVTEAQAQPQQQTTTPQQNTNNAASNISTKAGWVKQCVQIYSGSILNAIRDRNNDYLKVLFALAPKKAPATQQNTTQQADQQAAQSAT